MSRFPQSPELPLEDVTPRPQDWQWAEWALKQAESETKQEEESAKSSFTQGFYQWRFAYGSFRKAENEQMFEGSPEDADYQIHKYLGTTLVTIGMELLVISQRHEEDFLEDIGFDKRETTEMVAAIEDTLEAFHSSKNEKRIGRLVETVLGGEAGANS